MHLYANDEGSSSSQVLSSGGRMLSTSVGSVLSLSIGVDVLPCPRPPLLPRPRPPPLPRPLPRPLQRPQRDVPLPWMGESVGPGSSLAGAVGLLLMAT